MTIANLIEFNTLPAKCCADKKFAIASVEYKLDTQKLPRRVEVQAAGEHFSPEFVLTIDLQYSVFRNYLFGKRTWCYLFRFIKK